MIADGMPARSIIKILNDESIPSPGGRMWGISSIGGASTRKAGILNNELYRGRLIYNRTRLVTDPRTGRQRYVPNPESEWVVSEIPELRIVSEELWEDAQAKRRVLGAQRRQRRRRRPQADLKRMPGLTAFVLTGLVHCGACGSIKTIAHAGKYVCDAHRRSRACRNGRGTRESAVAEKLFVTLIQSLNDERGLKLKIRELLAQRLEEDKARRATIADLRARVDRLVELVELGRGGPKAPGERIKELERRIEDLTIVRGAPDVDLTVAQIKSRLANALTTASHYMGDRSYADPIRAMLAEVVDRIDLVPITTEWSGERIEIQLRENGWVRLYVHMHDAWPGPLGNGSRDNEDAGTVRAIHAAARALAS